MRANLLFGPAMVLAACFIAAPAAHAQVEGCPESDCVESQTSLVFNAQTNMMDAFTTATTDYTTSYWYDLCANLAVVQLNGPYLVNETVLLPSLTPAPCVSGAVELDLSGSVPTIPGRQYAAFGSAELHVFFQYDVIVPYPDCGSYCEGYWYDALGYSQLVTTQPSSADWPSIVYTYPYVLVPVAVVYEEIAMSGSAATAWSPPVIYSVIPNQWSAGATTTFTISGAGFGYSPDLTISGTGIVAYTNTCASPNSSPSCDTQIVATVTLDANTPSGMVETITVTANGLNPSGFLPAPIPGQSGQATAQATTQVFVPPVPQIWFNGTNVTNNGTPSCPGNVTCVFIGQKIALTTVISLPTGVTVQSYSWSMPQGTVVGGYTPSTARGTVQPFPITQPGTCQTLAESCSTFYWVDQASSRTLTFSYTLSSGQAGSANVTFNVGGPTNVGIAVTPPLNRDLIQIVQADQLVLGTTGLVMVFGANVASGQKGITLNASASLPGENPGEYSWIQLLTKYNWHYINAQGPWACSLDQSPELDGAYNYLYQTGPTTDDSPWVRADPDKGETEASFEATTYLMWKPNAASGCNGDACTILVPLANLSWSWTGDAINTQTSQPNGNTWMLMGCQTCSNGPAQVTSSHPEWRTSTAAMGGLGCLPMQ